MLELSVSYPILGLSYNWIPRCPPSLNLLSSLLAGQRVERRNRISNGCWRGSRKFADWRIRWRCRRPTKVTIFKHSRTPSSNNEPILLIRVSCLSFYPSPCVPRSNVISSAAHAHCPHAVLPYTGSPTLSAPAPTPTGWKTAMRGRFNRLFSGYRRQPADDPHDTTGAISIFRH